MTKNFEEWETHGFPTRTSRKGVNLHIFQTFQHQLDFGRGEGISRQALDAMKKLQRGKVRSNRLAFQVFDRTGPRDESRKRLQGNRPFCNRLGGSREGKERVESSCMLRPGARGYGS